jgi:MFS family permease
MQSTADRLLRTYLTLTVVSTGASSMIWGINTLFLLDAGLSIGQAFAANAFFTVGQVLFEVPTGVVADTVGRRMSYLLGTATLIVSTLLYLLLWQLKAGFGAWAVASALLGLGFTFFSGATEAWLVDGLTASGYEGSLESAFAKGQIAGGIAMVGGTIAGGVLAQSTNLGTPYLVRAGLLVLTFVVAWRAMRDVGFAPKPRVSVTAEMREILRASLDHGLRNPPVRWLMLAAPFTAGVSIYGFYAAQPYLLELYGHAGSYAVAGVSASIVAGAQILGGLSAPAVSKAFRARTSVLLFTVFVTAVVLVLIGLVSSLWLAMILLAIWATMFAAAVPVRQAFLNKLIPSAQRATVLSSDNLLASAGGVVIQPALGKAADVWSYGTAYLVSAAIQLLALPFIVLAGRARPVGAGLTQLSDGFAHRAPCMGEVRTSGGSCDGSSVGERCGGVCARSEWSRRGAGGSCRAATTWDRSTA